jgi:Xaa-Pro aminopeptidase
MLILSRSEKQLIREAAKWGDRAHSLMMEKVMPGSTHWEISHKASLQASKEMIKATDIKVELPYRLPAFVNFHVGPASAYPHAGCKEEYFRKIKVGDTCLSWADANVGGYGIEIERTFFIGPPNKQQRKMLEIAIKANEAAFNTIKPGVRCSDVCKASYRVFKEEGVWDLVLHHTGHGKPWLSHVPPYFDIGDHTILKPNMEFSVEPALYVKGLGGFRRGNTIFVTEDGAELVDNKTPMDIEDLIIKV